MTAFGKDAFVRSRYFLTRYEKYEVLYKAIAHPKVFDKALFKVSGTTIADAFLILSARLVPVHIKRLAHMY